MEPILKMGHYYLQIILMIATSSQTWSYPLDIDVKDVENGTRNSSFCYYKGSRHNDGDVINVDKPCLLCRCKSGALTCSLQICADIPEPPPPGCYIVHNRDQCCPQILCQTEEKESDVEVRTVSGASNNLDVCIVNGSSYAEGSALGSTNICEYCYCIRGQQKCIKPICSVPFEGCKAIYNQNSCCPISYDCRNQASNVPLQSEKNLECEIAGVVYAEGEMLSANSSNCENCYCMKGKVSCIPVKCETEFNEDCEPVYKPGQCCPISYICSKTIMGISENSIRSFSKQLDLESSTAGTDKNGDGIDFEGRTVTAGSEAAANSTEPMTTTVIQEDTLMESATVVTEVNDNPKGRVDDLEYVTEIGFQIKNIQETTSEPTTIETEESTLPLLVSYSGQTKNELVDIASRNHIGFLTDNKTTVPEERTSAAPNLEEIYSSSSSQSYDEYDSYDYNEPRLPPSLPNLIIFPFVAADAVVKDEEVSKKVQYDDSSIRRVGTEPVFYKDYFSPPTKTEGGFIPKEPPVLTDVYPEKDGGLLGQRPDIALPSITVPPKTNPDQCILKERLYEHGELLSDPGECQSCICYYGNVICREIICPPVGKGCFRSTDKDVKPCCGKIICSSKGETNPEELSDHDYLLSAEKSSKNPDKYPTTVFGVVEVTPSPLAELTRTKPASNLPSMISDLFTIYGEQQTKKPVTVTYKNLVVDYYPDFLVTTMRDDVRKKNYKNPVFYTTEIYPFTDKPETSGNVTFPTQATVTTSISTSEDDLERDSSKHSYDNVDSIRTSIRPIITVATEPSRLFQYYEVEEYKSTPKQQITRRTQPQNRPRPNKKTTDIPVYVKEEQQYNTPPAKPNSVKQKYSTKTKSKISTTMEAKETQIYPTTQKTPVEDSFSLDSVLRFFFNTETTTSAPPKRSNPARKTTRKDGVKKFTASPPEERSRQTTRETTPSTKYKDFDGKVQGTNEDENLFKRHTPESNKKNALGTLLKLAGCNIYGRMYRVGKIIAELSNPCLECVCTDFGVECNPLLC